MVKRNPNYAAAKAGDSLAAFQLVQETLSPAAVAVLEELIGPRSPLLVSAHAFEEAGVNAIPEAMAKELGNRLGLDVEASVVQVNLVGHTGADGFSRLARQAAFGGQVQPGREYVLVDDFVGQGGTLANLKGHVETQGGKVIGATVLTGKPFSAKLQPTAEQLSALRTKHGQVFETWWQEKFGHAFDCLTQSEARYLARSPDADTIRNRIAAAEQA